MRWRRHASFAWERCWSASRPAITVSIAGALVFSSEVQCQPKQRFSQAATFAMSASPDMQIHCVSASPGIAVVTGGSRGIGAAISEVLALQGYAVAVNYKASEAAADEVVARIRKSGGIASKFYGDMAVEEDIVKMFDEVQQFWPDLSLTVLVNNAGIIKSGMMQEVESFQTLEQMNKESFHEIFDVNVFSAMIAAREFALRSKSGSIVNISSGSAVIGTGPYGMTKAAMNALQAWLVKELTPRGIRVNTISPGLTKSDMTADFLKKRPDLRMIPMNRTGEPVEIAEVVAFLVSDKASYVSGANIRVAGGRPPGTFIG